MVFRKKDIPEWLHESNVYINLFGSSDSSSSSGSSSSGSSSSNSSSSNSSDENIDYIPDMFFTDITDISSPDDFVKVFEVARYWGVDYPDFFLSYIDNFPQEAFNVLRFYQDEAFDLIDLLIHPPFKLNWNLINQDSDIYLDLEIKNRDIILFYPAIHLYYINYNIGDDQIKSQYFVESLKLKRDDIYNLGEDLQFEIKNNQLFISPSPLIGTVPYPSIYLHNTEKISNDFADLFNYLSREYELYLIHLDESNEKNYPDDQDDQDYDDYDQSGDYQGDDYDQEDYTEEDQEDQENNALDEQDRLRSIL